MRIAGQFGYTHKDPERVYKLSRVKVCAPKTRPYKSRIKTEITSHSLYNHPYVVNHIQLVNVTFDNYEVNIFKVLAIIYTTDFM